MATLPWTAFLAPALALALAGPAGAQPARPAPQAPATASPPPAAAPSAPPAAALPDRTQANFGDWLVRCETQRPQGQPVVRVCEMAIAMTDQRGQTIAQVVLGRIGRNDAYRMLVQLPLELRVDQAARLLLDPAATPAEAINLPFRLCSAARGGCFGEVEALAPVLVTRMRARGEGQGRLDFRDSAGRDVQILFSFRGFGQAMDALERETGG
jgi:invasion protein IalB